MNPVEPTALEVLRVMAARFKSVQAAEILEQIVSPGGKSVAPGPREGYTPEQLSFLSAGYLKMTISALTTAFNLEFGTTKTPGQIKSTLQNHKIRCGRRHGERQYPESLIFSPEQVQFLRAGYKDYTVQELTALFNAKFCGNHHTGRIKSFLSNHGVISGRTGCFEKGSVSWNKGKKGYMGANATSFKKGQLPHNHKRLWTERISKDGYVEISVPEVNPHTGFPQRYRMKHVWLWEVHNGPVPPGSIVVFRDGNKGNIALENLMLVTRAELLSMNLHGYQSTPDELKPAVLVLAKLETKGAFRLRPARGRSTN
jgi:hypothetical protein